LNVAGRAAVLWDDGRRANFMLGRSFRTEQNAVFTDRSGPAHQGLRLDRGRRRPADRGLSLFTRARLDTTPSTSTAWRPAPTPPRSTARASCAT
jgi:LPS-assembly protein